MAINVVYLFKTSCGTIPNILAEHFTSIDLRSIFIEVSSGVAIVEMIEFLISVSHRHRSQNHTYRRNECFFLGLN